MSYSNPIRFGTNEGLGAAKTPSDLWLPVYGGEVLAAFDTALNFAGKVKMRSIESGVTAKFPVTWKIGSEYHEVGSELLGLDSPLREASISLDDRPLVSHFELDDIDVAFAHFEYRAEMAAQTGKELAKQLDKRIACLIAKAATDTTATGAGGTPFPSLLGGGDGILTGADISGNNDAAAVQMLNHLETLAVEMDNADIPTDQRYAMVRPGLWYALRNLGVPFASGAGANYITGNGALPQNAYFGQPNGTMGYDQSLTHLGFNIFRSVNMPTTNVTGVPAKYQVDFSNIWGLVWHPDCCGVVQKIGISTEMERDVRRQSDFMVAKMLTGGGTLRPYTACLIKTS